MDENARLRELLRKCRPSVANMAYGWPEDDALVKEIDAALTPAPEAPKGGEGGELLPCPFCGGTQIGWKWNETFSLDSSYATFGCLDCGASFPADDDNTLHPDDVFAWNSRATPAPGADFKAGMLRAAGIAYRICAETRHVTLGRKAEEAILAEAEKITSSDAGGAHGCAVQTSQPGEVPASASPAPLTLRAGKRYRDGHGQVKGPLHSIFWENGEEMLTDSYVVWHPDGTLAGGTREDKRSLVAEVEDSNA